MKKFWLTLLHIAVAGGGIAGAIYAPAAAPYIMAGTASINALLPSPLVPTKQQILANATTEEVKAAKNAS